LTTTTDLESRFLSAVPTEIRDVLNWFTVEQGRGVPFDELRDFAGRFLVAMHDDGALFPETPEESAPRTFALVLLHHVTSPKSAGAWLNLGLALRRMALYRTQDPEYLNRRRLLLALEALDRSLQLDPDNAGKNIRVDRTVFCLSRSRFIRRGGGVLFTRFRGRQIRPKTLAPLWICPPFCWQERRGAIRDG